MNHKQHTKNGANRLKAGKAKNAQILRYCHYLKKEYQHRRGIKSIGVILSRFKRVLLWARETIRAGAKYLNSGQIKRVKHRGGAAIWGAEGIRAKSGRGSGRKRYAGRGYQASGGTILLKRGRGYATKTARAG